MKFFICLVLFLFSVALVGVAQNTTFSDVFPIFEEHCTPCHQQGQIGPMPLTNFEEISAYGRMIDHVVSTRYMPPFLPSKNHNDFIGNRRLNDEDIVKIKNWVADGLINGAVVSTKNERDSTSLVDVDQLYFLPDSFEHYGVYYDQYRVFVVPTHLKSDTFVKAIEFDPGADAIVRHVSISIITDSLQTKNWDEWDPNLGYFSFGDVGVIPFESRWYNWRPGQTATKFEHDEIKFLPKGAILLFHVHYGPSHQRLKDLSQLKLKFSSNNANRRICQPLLHSGSFTKPVKPIEPNDRLKIHASFNVPESMIIHGVMPHAHFLCRDWEIFVKRNDGVSSLNLLNIEDWDFKWKQMYQYKIPVRLEKGDVIHVLATFDNSSDNLLNPSEPPATMEWGKRMFEEMMMVFFDYTLLSNQGAVHLDLFQNPTIIGHNQFAYKFNLPEEMRLSIRVSEVNANERIIIAKLKYYKKGDHKVIVTLPENVYGNYFISFYDDQATCISSQLISFVDSATLGLWNDR